MGNVIHGHESDHGVSGADGESGVGLITEEIRREPQNAHNYLLRARLKKDLGDMKGARADLDIAAQLDGSDHQVLFDRGVLRYDMGDQTGANEDLHRAFELEKAGGTGFFSFIRPEDLCVPCGQHSRLFSPGQRAPKGVNW